MEKQTQKSLKTALYLLRGATVFGIFFFMRMLIFFLTLNVASDKDTQIYADFPLWTIGLIVLVGSLFVYNSLARHFSLYDNGEMSSFLEHPSVGKRFAEYGRIIGTPAFLLEWGAAMALTSLLLPFGVFHEAELLFSFAGGLRYLLIYPVYLGVIFFLSLNAKYETRRHWLELYERRETNSLESRWKFVLKGLLILVIYPFAIPFTPVLLFVIYNAFTVLSYLLGLFSTVGLFIFLAVLVFFIFAFPKLRAFGIRRKFTKKLRSVAERAGYELSDIILERGLRLGEAGGMTFALRQGDRLYSCRLVVIEKRGLPLRFTSEKNAHFLYKIGFKKHFVSLAKHFDCSIEGEGRRILILTPEPKYVAVNSDGGEKRLFTGDKIWGCTVFESEAFFGAMDRRCLERTNGMFE